MAWNGSRVRGSHSGGGPTHWQYSRDSQDLRGREEFEQLARRVRCCRQAIHERTLDPLNLKAQLDASGALAMGVKRMPTQHHISGRSPDCCDCVIERPLGSASEAIRTVSSLKPIP